MPGAGAVPGERIAADAPQAGQRTRAPGRPDRDRALFQRPIDDLLRGDQRPAIRVELVGKRQFVRSEAMREAVHPDLAPPRSGFEPNTRFAQPGARPDFVGRGANAATAMLQSMADQFRFEIHGTQPDYWQQPQAAYQAPIWHLRPPARRNRAKAAADPRKNYPDDRSILRGFGAWKIRNFRRDCGAGMVVAVGLEPTTSRM